MCASLGSQAKGPVAESDGNRTRQAALAASPVLKTGGPTRRPFASSGPRLVSPPQSSIGHAVEETDNSGFGGRTAPPGGGKRSRRRRRAESGFLRRRQST